MKKLIKLFLIAYLLCNLNINVNHAADSCHDWLDIGTCPNIAGQWVSSSTYPVYDFPFYGDSSYFYINSIESHYQGFVELTNIADYDEWTQSSKPYNIEGWMETDCGWDETCTSTTFGYLDCEASIYYYDSSTSSWQNGTCYFKSLQATRTDTFNTTYQVWKICEEK